MWRYFDLSGAWNKDSPAAHAWSCWCGCRALRGGTVYASWSVGILTWPVTEMFRSIFRWLQPAMTKSIKNWTFEGNCTSYVIFTIIWLRNSHHGNPQLYKCVETYSWRLCHVRTQVIKDDRSVITTKRWYVDVSWSMWQILPENISRSTRKTMN